MNDSNQYNNQNNNGMVYSNGIPNQVVPPTVPITDNQVPMNYGMQEQYNQITPPQDANSMSEEAMVGGNNDVTSSTDVANDNVQDNANVIEEEQSPDSNQETKKEEIIRETIPAMKPEELYGYQPEKKVEEVPSTPPTEVSTTPDEANNQTTNTIPPEDTTVTKEKKKFNPLILILFIIIIGLGGYIYYSNLVHQKEIIRVRDECSPVSTTEGTKNLDINSTVIQDLYNKVKTNIREDLANFELNDEMKLYLAYRQIPIDKFYNTDCDNFNDGKMISFTCDERIDFVPTAFKQDTLMLEVKKLFGDSIIINHDDIQLANTCLGGFQYIAEKGEYVEGECTSFSTTAFKVEKELVSATSTESTIVLYEKVKYSGAEGQDYPEKLKNGTYKYTFKLDTNYNYIYVNKEYEV